MSTIAIIGGTGPQGKGLGYRFAKGGHDVILGSRSEARATEAATELNQRTTAGRSTAPQTLRLQRLPHWYYWPSRSMDTTTSSPNSHRIYPARS
jgi:NAD(P)-dependent dehydrogenase (short-subunit alcohol dehydrogenase family)